MTRPNFVREVLNSDLRLKIRAYFLGKILARFHGMARVPRRLCVLENFSVHKVWRGHNKEMNIATDEEKSEYIRFMNEDLESDRFQNGSIPQALTLMGNHVHEMSKILSQKLFSDHMRRHHGNYGRLINKLKNRSGKVAEDRPHTTLIENAHHEMETTFYIHANPVRAGIVKDARDYKWSTHQLYAFGKRKPWMRNIELPEWYIKLGRTAGLRERVYRQLYARYLEINGTSKRFFLKQRFFGAPHWVHMKELEVAAWRNEHSPPETK